MNMNMNISNSECSSGRESGWTMYLDQSSNSADQFDKAGGGNVDKEYRCKVANAEEEDGTYEDLSMVSDASSGPPHFHEDKGWFEETEDFGYTDTASASASASEQAKKKEKKKKAREHRGKHQHSYLDDTASSPALRCSKKDSALSSDEASKEPVLGLSHGFSATHLKGKSAFGKHFGFFHSSVAGKPSSEAPAGLQGRKRE